MAQLALQYGADDFGGTLIGEEVVSCTGSRSTELTGKRRLLMPFIRLDIRQRKEIIFIKLSVCIKVHSLTT